MSVLLTEIATPIRACSACAGDYEDPERTAWTDQLDEQRSDEPADERDDFPVQSQ